MKTKRVTLDYDNVKTIELFESASGKGIHIILNLKYPISFLEQLKIRNKLGDCRKRVRYSRIDMKLGFDPDMLFTHKKVRGKWRTEKLILKKTIS